MLPRLARERCAFDMSSDNFRVCGTRKGEVWLLKFDLLQLQTRGETELSKEGKLAESGKFLDAKGSSFSTKANYHEAFMKKLHELGWTLGTWGTFLGRTA